MTPRLFVTPHALAMYRERVNPEGTEDEIVSRLSAPTRVRRKPLKEAGKSVIDVRTKNGFRAIVAPPLTLGGAEVVVTIIRGALKKK